MTVIIYPTKAIELLREAIEERGSEYTYPRGLDESRCRYYHSEESQPGCLVGLALAKAGVTYARLNELDVPEGGTGAFSLNTLDLGDVEVTFDAATVFARAQGIQDQGDSWGEALAAAEEELRELTACAGTLDD